MGKTIVEPKTVEIKVGAAKTSSQENELVRHEFAKFDFDEKMKEASCRLQYQMDLAQSLFRALTLGNGGAIIALLTFIGNNDAAVDKNAIWWAFLLYGFGLVGVFCGYIGGFFSQRYFYVSTIYEAWNAQATHVGEIGAYNHIDPYNKGHVALFAATGFAVISLIAFIAASMLGLAAIT